jgi:hypothetical protein
MDAKIDYLSFTVMVDCRDRAGQAAQLQAAADAIWQRHPPVGEFLEGLQRWQPGGARGHYGASAWQPDTFISVRFGGSANHILVEFPGTACQAARDAGLLDQIVASAAARLTRLDLAVDIPGGCSPSEFVAAGFNERFKGRATITSAEGETEYVGSMKSERFARIYKYAPPHPRSGTLRVEHVLRSDYAKAAASAMVGRTVVDLAALCGNSWGWQSAAWQPEALTDGKLKATRSDRHEPGRLRWLFQVCIPALVKAERDGLLSVDELLERIECIKQGYQAAATA